MRGHLKPPWQSDSQSGGRKSERKMWAGTFIVVFLWKEQVKQNKQAQQVGDRLDVTHFSRLWDVAASHLPFRYLEPGPVVMRVRG